MTEIITVRYQFEILRAFSHALVPLHHGAINVQDGLRHFGASWDGPAVQIDFLPIVENIMRLVLAKEGYGRVSDRETESSKWDVSLAKKQC